MQQDNILRLSLVQYDIVWENKQRNLEYLHNILSDLSGKTDIVVLPETFTTGFSMNSHNLAETIEGNTIAQLKSWAKAFDFAICGSFIAEDNGDFYNRGFFISSSFEAYYDKRHLFRMGSESKYFSHGNNQLIIEHKGFNICLLICYDLRFPVWSRNVDNAYDLLVYVANWPASRAKVWKALLTARAIENMSYVCGVNRIGTDGNGLAHSGDSMLINAKGDEMSSMALNQEQVETVYISKAELEQFRAKFPVWKDADRFEIRE